MNSLRHKHRSFIYSLFIHLMLGAAVLGLYYASHDKKHEEYSTVDLRSLQICTPLPPKSSPEEPVSEKCACAEAPVLPRQAVTEPKKISKSKPLPPPAQNQMTAKTVQAQEDQKEFRKDELQEVAEAETSEDTVCKTATVTAQQPQETPTAAAVASEPSLSYEARYMQDNIALINALIKQNLNYPSLAKKRGLQGRAIVSFTINPQGEVSNIETSGEAAVILKKSARKTIEKASADFPRPETRLALQIPIVYTLN